MTTRSADYLLAAASGVLLALSFPTIGHPACAWVALAPLMIALQRGTLRRAFLLGAIGGVIYFTGTLYWLTRVMAVYGGLSSWVAVLVNVALIAFLALFLSAFAVALRRLIFVFGPRALLAAPFIWVATELGRTHLMGGFPWVLLGYSQTTVLPVAQFASLFGVYGLSALVSAVSATAAFAAIGLDGKENRDRLGRLIPLVAVLLLVLGTAAWGSRRIARAELTQAGDPIKVGLLQGNVDQAEKWDSRRASSIFSNYVHMTRQAIAEGAELVIWPESSTPFLFEDEHTDREATEVVRTLARQAKVAILLGSNQIDYGTPNTYFNAAFLVQPDGTTGGEYRKVHLVPFGEYVPLKKLLFFAESLVENAGDFSPGASSVMLPVNGHLVSTAICYEIVYPSLIRESVRLGSELLTTITNDAWFGPTSAPVQHFQQAAMRAIEEGRYLVRAANTGISGIVDPYGRVLAETRIYEPAVMVGEARLLRVSTLYARLGDSLAYASAALTFLLLIQSWVWRRSTI